MKKFYLILTFIILIAVTYYISGFIIGQKFSGTITDIQDRTPTDGACFVTVDDKTITLGGGMSINPQAMGDVINLKRSYGCLDKSSIGTRVEVFAKKSSITGYTLRGSKLYYIKRITN